MEEEQRQLSRHLSRVAAILALSAKKAITDRRTFVSDLQSIYQKDDFVKSINIQSTNDIDSSTSWNEIMLTVHRTAIAEGDRPLGKSSKAVLMSRNNCASLMLDTVQLATSSSDALLRIDDLMACVFEVLRGQIYNSYHKTYIKILMDHVLAKKIYWSEVTAEQWEELLRIIVKLYREHKDISKRIVLLDTMSFVVQLGCQQSHLALEVKKILPFLEKIFRETGTKEEPMLKALYKLTYAICQQIGTESRIALCKFSEKSLPSIIDSRASSEKFDMLLPLVQCHHPGGVSLDHDTAYARDSTQWKEIITSIHSNIIEAMGTKDLTPSFWKLCSEVYRQMIKDPKLFMDEPSSRTDEGDEPSRKRRRLTVVRKPIRKPIDLLMDDLNVPFVQILTTLLKKYPDSLASSDYPEFLGTLTKIIESSITNAPIMDELFRLCMVIIKAEKDRFRDAEQTEKVRLCWEKICATVLLILSANQNAMMGHKLLQLIIERKDVLDMKEFFPLYLRSQMRWSASCVESLLTFCKHSRIPPELPESNSSAPKPIFTLRESLVHWALKIPSSKLSTEIPATSLANLLTALAMKFNYTREFREFMDNSARADAEKIAAVEALKSELFDDRERKALSDIERCHMALDFRDDIFEHPEEPRTEHSTNFSTVVVPRIFNLLMLSLGKSLATPITPENVAVVVTKVTVAAKLISNFLELKASLEAPMSRLLVAFDETYQKILIQLQKMTVPSCPYLVDALEALELFYRTSYHCKVTRTIVESTSLEFNIYLHEFATDDENPENEDDLQISVRDFSTKTMTYKLPNACRVRNSANRILCHFMCARIGEEISATQLRVQMNIMNIELYQSTSSADLRRALVTLKTFGLSGQSSTSEKSLDYAKTFVKDLYDSRRRDEIAVRGILNVLPHLIKSSTTFPGSWDSLLNLLSDIFASLGGGNYGPLVHAEFVKCLTKLIPFDPLPTLKIEGAEVSIIRILASQICSPFYSVRLEAALALSEIFASDKLDVPRKRGYFETITVAFSQLFAIEDTIDEATRADEMSTRSATAIHVLAAVIRSDEILRVEALDTMMNLPINRGVNTATIAKALEFATRDENQRRRLLDTNLHALLARWFAARRSFATFPWIVVGCDDQEEFSRRHIDRLLGVKLQRLELREFEVLCKNLEVSFARQIERSFPLVMTLLGSMIVGDSTNREIKAYASSIHERLRSNSGEFAKVRNFPSLLTEKLPDVVVDLLRRLRDREHLFGFLDVDVHLPEVNLPNLSAESVDRCLRRLEDDLEEDNCSLVEHLVTRQPFALQTILLTLLRDVHDAEGSTNQVLAFYRYVYFYAWILPDIRLAHFDPMSLYVVRDLTHSLLSIIEEIPAIREIACTFFRIFLREVLPSRINDVREILGFLVSRLVRLLQTGKARGASDVLRFLVIENREILSEDIAKLDVFPDEDVFAALKDVQDDLKYAANGFYDLEHDIEHFLRANGEETLCYSLPGLLHLRTELKSRRNELNKLYRRLGSFQGFQSDPASSAVHRLIRRLVELARSSQPEISLAAVKCLGEIGPADLTALILRPDSGNGMKDTGDVDTLTFTVISRLVDYLVSDDLVLRRTSAAALRAVMSTSTGTKFKVKSVIEDFVRLTETTRRNIHAYVYPFVAPSTRNTRFMRIGIDQEKWKIYTGATNDLWMPSRRESYARWIVDITCGCLGCFVDFYAEDLEPVCRVSVEFSETLLPRLLHLATVTRETLVKDVCRCVDRFFGRLLEELVEAEASTARNCPTSSYECVKRMLDVVEFLRVQRIDSEILDVDYLRIAKGAQYCSAYCTSALYAELWCQRLLNDEKLLQKKRPGSWTSPIVSICEVDPENGRLLQEIAREACVQIGDPDSIDGCGISYLIYPAFKTQRDIHLRLWDKVTLAYDVEMSCGRNVTRGMIKALQQSGHQYLVKCLIEKARKRPQEDVDDLMYETAWRLADWSILETNPASTDSTTSRTCDAFDYHAAHYCALESLRDDDLLSAKNALHEARMCIAQSLRDMNLECCQSLYPMLSQLQMLREIEDFATAKPESYEQLVDAWSQEDLNESHSFLHAEPILSQRLVMYEMRNCIGSAAKMDLTVMIGHLKIAEIAEAQGYLPIAYRLLGTLGKKENLPAAVVDRLSYQKALLDWKEKDQYMGRLVLRKMLRRPNLDPGLRAKALLVYGNWMAEMTCEGNADIINKYYKGSIRASGDVDDFETRMKAQADLAQFNDSQHRQIVEFTKTPQYASLVKCYEMRNSKPSDEGTKSDNDDVKRAIRIHEKQLDIDAAEFKYINADMKKYLYSAVRNYLQILTTTNNYDRFVYRLVSLWLDNMSDDELNKIIEENLPKVASYKFIGLLPQLAVHMSNDTKLFTVNIINIIKRCALEHPHHSLAILLTLRNAHKDDEYKLSTISAQIQSKTRLEPRVAAANALISSLTQTKVGPIIHEMDQLSTALIWLAYYKVPEAEANKRVQRISRHQPITKIRNFDRTVVPTVTLAVRPSCNYDNIDGIRNYEETFEDLGGIHAPKKIVCVDSSGISRRQLLKCQYDLRLDAIIQQVSVVVNSMLKETASTKTRELRIRTYKVVPLSRRSGVLEWCQNATPMSQILCDTSTTTGMHTKYYPNDWNVEKCAAKLREVHELSFAVKLQTFLECCKNLRPAFHHYFMEKYPSASMWFEKRLNYVRSVATTSMFGYMLGVGSRCCKNILIDQNTAEVIHIDFGVAFDEGKVGATPETVPFRLTRDMEAAMGFSGVEGVMKNSCQQTVNVLRERRKTLITLLQVLLYDPLYKWSLVLVDNKDNPGPSGRSRRGSTNDRETAATKLNKVADRAVLKVAQKLEGIEKGAPMSVVGQVDRLIEEARDPEKLCRMPCDWQSYL